MKTKALLIALMCTLSSFAMTSCGSEDGGSVSYSAKNSADSGRSAEGAKAEEKADSGDDIEIGAEMAEEDAEIMESPKLADIESDEADGETADDAETGEKDEEIEESEKIEESEETDDPDTRSDLSDAFVLTAGEWNDNNNWGFFTNLVNNGVISFPSFSLNPVNRIKVTVQNNGTPVRNRRVQLIGDDGSAVWSSVTDKDGIAYFFYDSPMDFKIKTEGSDKLEGISTASTSDEQGNSTASSTETVIDIADEPVEYSKTEVMFILDTTGSMGDEIMYLQKDFSSIAEEVQKDGMTFSVNFYRDKGDDYVVKHNGFTSDVKEVQKLLNDESADGGGDYPEAVAEALNETIVNGSWSDDSNKIAFLIFDAPPHDDSGEMIYKAISNASERGIHIVPVVASEADRQAELFGRAVSIMTNSNYVFLTDDSGVGGSHLEPIIGSYDVELLHDIIVRNINQIAE